MRKLKITSLVLAVIMIVSMLPLGMVSAFAAEPTPDLTISTAKQFADFIDSLKSGTTYDGKLVVLTADIDMAKYSTESGWKWPTFHCTKTVASKNMYVGYFGGTLDGKGHTLTVSITHPGNFKVDGVDYDPSNAANFGGDLPAGKTATFQNLTLAGTYNAGGRWQKGMLYYNVYGTVNYINVKHTLTSTNSNGNFGGVVGVVQKGGTLNVTNCEFSGAHSGAWNGNIAGVVHSVSAGGTVAVTDTVYSGSVKNTRTTGASNSIAGVAGFIDHNAGTVTFNNCAFTGVLEHLIPSTYNVDKQGNVTKHVIEEMGAFVSYNTGSVTINDSLMSGSMLTKNQAHVGGFVGYNKGTLTIDDSVMSGSIVAENGWTTTPSADNKADFTATMGGFLGYQDAGTVSVTDSMVVGLLDDPQYVKYTDNKGTEATNDDVHYWSRYYTGGFFGIAKGAGVTLTDCAMYGIIKGTSDAAGGLAAQMYPSSGTTTLKVNNCIHAGTVYEGTGVSGRYVFGASNSTASSQNIQIGTSNYGGQHCLMHGSAYTVNTTRGDKQSPYCIANRQALSDANFDATINALTTYDTTKTDAFTVEKASAIANFRADWIFTDGLPYPKGCADVLEDAFVIDNASELLLFATLLNNNVDFGGMTIKLNADITLNAGFDAFAETVSAPATVWPLNTNNKSFAGTFDGQGHTISGIYLKASGEGVGIFGNVATKTTGEVKNVKIVNSYVEGNSNGTGGIFGEVDNETTTQKLAAGTEINTKAIVDNVYANINVTSTTANGNSNLGAGGIIGGSRADVLIKNTAFVGKVFGGSRGVAAFVGAVRPFQDGANYYYNTITVENCYAEATLTGDNRTNYNADCTEVGNTTNTTNEGVIRNQTFVGGVVGYSNSDTTTHNVSNVVLNNIIDGFASQTVLVCKEVEKTVDGQKVKVKENVSTTMIGYDGYIYAGAWCSKQPWNITNVKYVATAGTASDAFSTSSAGNNAVITLNGATTNRIGLNACKVASAADLPKVLYAFDADMSVTLTDSLAFNVYVDQDDIILNDANTGAMAITVNGEAANGALANGAYKFTYTGILPQEMTDNLAVSMGVINKATTIKAYLATLLTDARAQDVAADLLRYGAAAQTVSGYKLNALATDGLTLTGLGTTFTTVTATTPVKGTNVKRVALRLENTLALVGNNGTVVPVNANEMDTVKTVGDAQCSVAAYVKWAINGGVTDAEDLALIRAIYAYGLSAKAYN